MRTYPMLTLNVCNFGIKTTICDLHINVKLGLPIFMNSAQPIIILGLGHFVIFL
jgi:hypothetical protein